MSHTVTAHEIFNNIMKYLSEYKNLMQDWDFDLNPGLDPSTITSGSHISITWRCHKCGRVWKAEVHRRTLGDGCSCEAKERRIKRLQKTLVEKRGSLADYRPDLAKQWHPTKNGDLKPTDVMATSSYKVWWKDDEGHEWQQQISTRNRSGSPEGVPQGKLVKGYNDFATKHPDLVKQWHPTKNMPYGPDDYVAWSGTKAWWLCEKGHEWEASISSRSGGRGCPECNKERNTSFPEQVIYYYVRRAFPDAINRYLPEKFLEIDVFIPEYKIGIEYDGSYYHSTKRKQQIDKKKNDRVRELGITLLRVVEKGGIVSEGSQYVIECDSRNNKAEKLNSMIVELFETISKIIGVKIAVKPEVAADATHIYEQYVISEKENSIAAKALELLDEWDYEKNGYLKPEYVQVGSNKKVWWKCRKCGYEWQSPVTNRVRGTQCPVCKHNAVAPGINDISTTNPELLEEWDYSKNTDVRPEDLSVMSGKTVWWRCRTCGHSWKASVANKSRGRSCPVCSGKVATYEKSLATVNPEIAAEWDYEKNGIVTPADVLPGSDKRVLWRCEKGHEWKAAISSRVKGNGCPYCGNKLLLKGFNDFASQHPELISEWDSSNEVRPYEVFSGSNKKIKWICTKGHTWETTVAHRVGGNGCPFCANRRIRKGENDLATLYPQLATEWDYAKNGDFGPEDATPGSNRKVWWKCSKCEGEWQAIINSRVHGRGCPFCAGTKPIKGKNDFATLCKNLMEEWDYLRNEGLDPSDFMPHSRKKVWWKCRMCGYEWMSTIGGRSDGRGCPSCAHKV